MKIIDTLFKNDDFKIVNTHPFRPSTGLKRRNDDIKIRCLLYLIEIFSEYYTRRMSNYYKCIVRMNDIMNRKLREKLHQNMNIF